MNHLANRLVGAQLQRMRSEANLTQKQVAERLGVPQSVVCKLEKGERSMHLVEVTPYSIALGVKPDVLFARANHALISYALAHR